MAYTYNTIPTVSTGDVYTATAHNNIVENVNNYRVPPACQVRRTTNQTSYTADAAITWQSAAFDTEKDNDAAQPMWEASPNPSRITIRTSGLYLITFTGQATLSSAATTPCLVRIRISGTNFSNIFLPMFNNNDARWNTSLLASLTSGQYVEGAWQPNSGSGLTISGTTAAQQENQTRLTVAWLGQVS
jgi:hypothetical protein